MQWNPKLSFISIGLIIIFVVYIFNKFLQEVDLALAFSDILSKDLSLSIIHQERRNHIEHVCKMYHKKIENDYSIYRPKENWKSIVTESYAQKDRDRGILYSKDGPTPFIWCKVPKAGSLSWVYLFSYLWYLKDTDDFNHGQENMRLKKAWSTKTKKQEFFYNVATKTFSFLIARHPFSRLLSAYKEKFFIADEKSFDIRLSFEERKMEKYRKMIKQYMKTGQEVKSNNGVPTFGEFVKYMLDEPVKDMNVHWLPMYYRCMPCQMNYTIIAKIDTIKDDSQEIIKQLGIGGSNKSLQHTHKSKGKSEGLTEKDYYSELDRETLDRLYKFYEMDFLLFDFKADDYYAYVKDN